MMLANDLKTYYDEVRRYLDCPKDEQDRLLLSVNKQVIELQEEKASSSFEYHCLCRSCGSCFIYTCHLYINYSVWCQN